MHEKIIHMKIVYQLYLVQVSHLSLSAPTTENTNGKHPVLTIARIGDEIHDAHQRTNNR